MLKLCTCTGMSAASRQFHWDKRKRKFVQLGSNEKVQGGKRIKTESGKVRLITQVLQYGATFMLKHCLFVKVCL